MVSMTYSCIVLKSAEACRGRNKDPLRSPTPTLRTHSVLFGDWIDLLALVLRMDQCTSTKHLHENKQISVQTNRSTVETKSIYIAVCVCVCVCVCVLCVLCVRPLPFSPLINSYDRYRTAKMQTTWQRSHARVTMLQGFARTKRARTHEHAIYHHCDGTRASLNSAASNSITERSCEKSRNPQSPR